MSSDKYRAVEFSEHTLETYPSGLRADSLVRLKSDLQILDHLGQPTGELHCAGKIWTVLPGLPHEPEVVWLREAGGDLHTWSDSDFLESFEVIDSGDA